MNYEATVPPLLLAVLNQTFSCAMPILSFAFKGLLHNVHRPVSYFLTQSSVFDIQKGCYV